MKIKTVFPNKTIFKNVPPGDIFAADRNELYVKLEANYRAVSLRTGGIYTFPWDKKIQLAQEISVTF